MLTNSDCKQLRSRTLDSVRLLKIRPEKVKENKRKNWRQGSISDVCDHIRLSLPNSTINVWLKESDEGTRDYIISIAEAIDSFLSNNIVRSIENISEINISTKQKTAIGDYKTVSDIIPGQPLSETVKDENGLMVINVNAYPEYVKKASYVGELHGFYPIGVGSIEKNSYVYPIIHALGHVLDSFLMHPGLLLYIGESSDSGDAYSIIVKDLLLEFKDYNLSSSAISKQATFTDSDMDESFADAFTSISLTPNEKQDIYVKRLKTFLEMINKFQKNIQNQFSDTEEPTIDSDVRDNLVAFRDYCKSANLPITYNKILEQIKRLPNSEE